MDISVESTLDMFGGELPCSVGFGDMELVETIGGISASFEIQADVWEVGLSEER